MKLFIAHLHFVPTLLLQKLTLFFLIADSFLLDHRAIPLFLKGPTSQMCSVKNQLFHFLLINQPAQFFIQTPDEFKAFLLALKFISSTLFCP